MPALQDCETIRPLLSVYTDNEATPAEAALVDAHVAGCERCASELAFLFTSHVLLRRLPEALPPADLRARIAAATYARPTLSRRIAALLQPAPARLALGTAVAAAVVAAVLLRAPAGPGPAGPSIADNSATEPGKPYLDPVSPPPVVTIPSPEPPAPQATVRTTPPKPSPDRVAVTVREPRKTPEPQKVAKDTGASRKATVVKTATRPQRTQTARGSVAPAPKGAVVKSRDMVQASGRIAARPVETVAPAGDPVLRMPSVPEMPPIPQPAPDAVAARPAPPAPEPIAVAQSRTLEGDVTAEGTLRLASLVRTPVTPGTQTVTVARQNRKQGRSLTSTNELGQGGGGAGTFVSLPTNF